MEGINSHFALLYLLERFVFRVLEFLRRWYVLGWRAVLHATMRRLGSLDRKFALKITLLHFFVPLYGDETFLGRILGIVFRSMRIVTALVVYLVIIAGAAAACLIWALIPVYLVAKTLGF